MITLPDRKALAGQTGDAGKDRPVDKDGNAYLNDESGVPVLPPRMKAPTPTAPCPGWEPVTIASQVLLSQTPGSRVDVSAIPGDPPER